MLLRDKISHALENKRGYEQLLNSDTSFIAAQIFSMLGQEIVQGLFILKEIYVESGKFHVEFREK